MNYLRFIRLADFTWWIWFITASLLLLGLIVSPSYLLAAIVLSVAQTLYFIARESSLSSFPVQLRIAYVLLLLVSYLPPLRLLFWIPTVGTFALVFFGYCLMARFLSLLPWNRSEPLSPKLLWRTFFRAPSLDATVQAQSAASCPGGVCTLEVQLGKSVRG